MAASPEGGDAARRRAPSLTALFLLCLEIGLFSFSGGLSGWLHQEFARRRGWIDEDDFASSLAIAQMLPARPSCPGSALPGSPNTSCASTTDASLEIGCALVEPGRDAAELLELAEKSARSGSAVGRVRVRRCAEGGCDSGSGYARCRRGRLSDRPRLGCRSPGRRSAARPAAPRSVPAPRSSPGPAPPRKDEPRRRPVSVDHGVDLRAQSAARATGGVIRAPFFSASRVLVGADDRAVDELQGLPRALRTSAARHPASPSD